MKCKLNPAITTWLYQAFLWVTLLPLLCLVVSISVYGISYMFGTVAYAIDSELLYHLLINDHQIYEDRLDFITSIGLALFITPLILIVGTIVLLIMISVAYSETKESLNVRKHDLEYRFQTTSVPWYRVLLSYIFVCEKTKDL